MPTAIAFDRAAAEFDAAADVADRLVVGASDLAGPSTLSGGTLTLLTSATLDVADRTAVAVARDLRDLADTCRARAETCRLHADALTQHDRDVRAWLDQRDSIPDGEPIPSRPVRPARPAPWVEV